CEGTSLTITCPSGSRVHIQEANYGRTGPSSDDPCGRPEDSNQNCREPDSLSIVRNECEGQQTCTVAVNSGTFGGDPCPGTFKYLQVEYICSQRTIICETNTGTITCPSGEKITILYANYGRTAPQSVDLCNDPRDTNKDCRAATSEATVKVACDGQSTCTLTPTNTLFGDPCESSIGCEGTSLTITCPSGSRVHIEKANYGRIGPSSDNPCGRPEDSNQTCRDQDSLSIVRNQCEGQQTCSVAVNSGTFGGDPCPGTSKYLQVEYICSRKRYNIY
ncbi:hypothetical protein FSP39_024663, partial [Pinctada imbricata]